MSIQLAWRRARTATVIFASASLVFSAIALAEPKKALDEVEITGDGAFSLLDFAEIKFERLKNLFNWGKLGAAIFSGDSAEAGKAATEISARLADDENQKVYGKPFWTFVEMVGYCRAKNSEKCEETIDSFSLYLLAVPMCLEVPVRCREAVETVQNGEEIGKWFSLVLRPYVDQLADRQMGLNIAGIGFAVADDLDLQSKRPVPNSTISTSARPILPSDFVMDPEETRREVDRNVSDMMAGIIRLPGQIAPAGSPLNSGALESPIAGLGGGANSPRSSVAAFGPGQWTYVSGISGPNGSSGYWKRTVIDATGIHTETSLTNPNVSPATPSSNATTSSSSSTGTGSGSALSNGGKTAVPASGNARIQVDPALTRTGGTSQRLTGNVFKNTVVRENATASTTLSPATGQQLEVSRLNDDPLIDPATGEVYRQWQSSGQLNPAVHFIIPPELLERNKPAPMRDMSGASLMPTSLPFVPNLPGPSHANVKIERALLGEGKTNLKPPTALAARPAPRPTVVQRTATARPVNAAPTTEPDAAPDEPAPEGGAGISTDQAIDLLNGVAGILGAASSMAPSRSYSPPPQVVGRPQASPPALQRIPRQNSQSTITGF